MSNGRFSRGVFATCSLVLLVTALMVPATAAAAGGYYTVTLNTDCRGFAGDGWHTYQIKLKAKVVARGSTPTDLLQIRSVAQRQRHDGSWLVVEAWLPDETFSFTPDGTTHSLQLGRSFTMPTTDQRHGDNPHRLKFTLTAYDGNTLLFRDVITKSCVN